MARTWTTIVLPDPAGASSAVLQQIAISGDRVAALGQATTPAGTVPIAELSVNGGSQLAAGAVQLAGTGHHVHRADRELRRLYRRGPVRRARAAAGRRLDLGQRDLMDAGADRRPDRPQTGGSYQISALAPSGNAVTGIGSLATQAARKSSP